MATASGSETTIPPFPQVDDENDDCYDKQNMNQAAGNMKAEAQQPEDHEDRENCPKHFFSTFSAPCPRAGNIRPGIIVHLQRDA